MLRSLSLGLAVLTLLAPAVSAQEPDPRIYFLRDDAIWSCALDGGGPREELAKVAHGFSAFSIVGDRLATYVPHTDVSRVVVARGAEPPLVIPIQGFVHEIAWRPTVDGTPPTEITVVAERPQDHNTLVRIDVTDDDPRPVPLFEDDRRAKVFAWSPDGRFLAYARTLKTETEQYADMVSVHWTSRYELYDPDSGATQQLLENLEGHPTAAAFSPYGTRLALGFRGHGLHVVDLAGDVVGPHRALDRRCTGDYGLWWDAGGTRILSHRRLPRENYSDPKEDALLLVPLEGEALQIPLGQTIYHTAWDPSGTAVLLSDGTKRLVRWSLGDGSTEVLLEPLEYFSRLAVAPSLPQRAR